MGDESLTGITPEEGLSPGSLNTTKTAEEDAIFRFSHQSDDNGSQQSQQAGPASHASDDEDLERELLASYDEEGATLTAMSSQHGTEDEEDDDKVLFPFVPPWSQAAPANMPLEAGPVAINPVPSAAASQQITLSALSASTQLITARRPTVTRPPLERSNSISGLMSRCYQAFGKVFLLVRQYEHALATYEKALLLKPDNSNLSLGKGEALLGLQQNEEALAAYEQALLLNPDSIAAYRGRGKAYEHLAQQAFETMKQQAQEYHEKARQLGEE